MSCREKAPGEGRRPEGEGANIDRRLVPYHEKWKRIHLASSLFNDLYICTVHGSFCDGVRRLGTAILNKNTKSSKTENDLKAMR